MGDPTVYAYHRAHLAVVRLKGRAKDHRCVTCGGRADHWSYNHTDPRPLLTDSGSPFSENADHYLPRCAPCHKRFDDMQRALDGIGVNIHDLEADIRHAVAQLRLARRERDRAAIDHWQDELDRIVRPIDRWRPTI